MSQNLTQICVTAFIAPQSLISLPPYAEASTEAPQLIISVGVYMSDRSISKICNFTNAANALNYAFMLKGDNCPISKNAFTLLQAEIKRTNAVSSRAQAKAKEKAKQEAEKKAEAEAAQILELSEKTPLEKQYEEMKVKHPDAILLFRVGDFYECFKEDAVKASELLGITLTRRAKSKSEFVELAGFPHHALDTYLPKLVRAGHRVAICEQLEQPKQSKRRVKRA